MMERWFCYDIWNRARMKWVGANGWLRHVRNECKGHGGLGDEAWGVGHG